MVKLPYLGTGVDYNSGFVNANGTIYIVGGFHTKHQIWNNESKRYQDLHDFKKHLKYDEIHGAALIFVPSKQQIIMIGGVDKMKLVGLDDYSDTEYSSRMIGDIWRYYIKTNKWEKISGISFKYSFVSLT